MTEVACDYPGENVAGGVPPVQGPCGGGRCCLPRTSKEARCSGCARKRRGRGGSPLQAVDGRALQFLFFYYFYFLFLPFLGLLPRHMEVPRLGVESEP